MKITYFQWNNILNETKGNRKPHFKRNRLSDADILNLIYKSSGSQVAANGKLWFQNRAKCSFIVLSTISTQNIHKILFKQICWPTKPNIHENVHVGIWHTIKCSYENDLDLWFSCEIQSSFAIVLLPPMRFSIYNMHIWIMTYIAWLHVQFL